jgi:hypothetical protein
VREAAPGGTSIRLRSAWTRVRTWSVERRLLVLLVLAPLFGLIGVVLAEVVPDGRIAYHLLRADHAELLGPTQASTSPLATRRDHWTECNRLSTGLGDPPGTNIIQSALKNPTYVGCPRLHEALLDLERTGRLDPGITYLRYWHGYTVITRPAVGILGLAGARWIAFSLLLGTIAGLVASVSRSLGFVVAVLLVAPVVLTTDAAIAMLSIGQALGVTSALAGGWLVFAVCRRWPTWRVAGLVAGLAGAVSVYFDVLTTMPGAMALAAGGATLGVCASRAAAPLLHLWRVTLAAVVGWGVGLVWMWVSKWVLATAVVDVGEVVRSVRTQIAFRLSGEHHSVSDRPTAGLTRNLREWWSHPLTPWVVVTTALIVVSLVSLSWLRRRDASASREVARCCGVIAAAFAAWFLTLNNHTQIHAWFVYRSVPLAFGVLAAIAVAATADDRGARRIPDWAGPPARVALPD